jgi:hypothetical protein
MPPKPANDSVNEACRHVMIPVFEAILVSVMQSGFCERTVAETMLALARENRDAVARQG